MSRILLRTSEPSGEQCAVRPKGALLDVIDIALLVCRYICSIGRAVPPKGALNSRSTEIRIRL